MKRIHAYTTKHYPELDLNDMITRAYNHISKKFGDCGYAKMWIVDEEFDKFKDDVKELLKDKYILGVKYMEVNDIMNIKEKVINQKISSNKKTSLSINDTDSNINVNKFNNDRGTKNNITLKDLLNSNNESLLVVLLNTITDKKLLQEWLDNDPRVDYLIYKIDINKLLQYNLLIPNSILSDEKFPNYLIKNVINKTESLIDIRSYLYKFQNTNPELYEKLVIEYKKYVNVILNSYDNNIQIFNLYFDNNYIDKYLLTNQLQEKLKISDEVQKIKVLKEETSFKLSEIVVDSIFEDNIYNVKLNLNEIIRYTNDIMFRKL